MAQDTAIARCMHCVSLANFSQGRASQQPNEPSFVPITAVNWFCIKSCRAVLGGDMLVQLLTLIPAAVDTLRWV